MMSNLLLCNTVFAFALSLAIRFEEFGDLTVKNTFTIVPIIPEDSYVYGWRIDSSIWMMNAWSLI